MLKVGVLLLCKTLPRYSLALASKEARKRLWLDDGRHDHFLQLLEDLHPCVTNVELKSFQITLDNLL